MQPKVTPLSYTYKKPDTEVWVLNLDDIPVDKALIKDQQIIYIGPESMGGNHKHPRVEWFIGLGDVVLVWLDEQNQKHEQHMNPNGELLFIEVPAYLPHAVVNKSAIKSAVLFEWSDAKSTPTDTERIEVVSAS